MKRLFICLVMFVFVFSGCATLRQRSPGVNSAQNQKTNLNNFEKETKKSVPIIVGFKLLEDRRPQKDITFMTSVRENVSTKVFESIKNTQIFSSVNFPPQGEEGIIVSGEIRKFSWRTYDTMISYIPGLNVLNFFAIPSTNTYGEVEVYLELKDTKQDKVIFSFVEEYVKRSKYNIYNFKPSKADDDLAYCFNVVLNKIKDRFLLERNKILELTASKTSKIPESKKEPEVKEITPVDKEKASEQTGEDKK